MGKKLLNAKQLKSVLDDYKLAGSLPKKSLAGYCKYYRLNQLANLSSHKIGFLVSQTNRLCVQTFTPCSPIVGTVVLVHGYLEHLALQQPLINYLLSLGFKVIGFDLPGHGLSDGLRYWIDSFKRYAWQLHDVLTELGPEIVGPLSFLGHSTGAAVVMGRQLLLPKSLDHWSSSRQVLLAPLVKAHNWRSIYSQYAWLRLFTKWVPRFMSINTHNADYLTFSRNDPLQSRWLPVAWLKAMIAWDSHCCNLQPLPTETWVIQGDNDETVDWQYNVEKLKQIYPQAEVVMINDAKHQLINESLYYQQQVFHSIGEAITKA